MRNVPRDTESSPKRVLVVGAGIIGLCTAYYLKQSGADVLVVERDRPGAGASHGNAGWITPVLAAPLPGPGVMAVALRSLLDRDSPLYVDARVAPRLVPWLYRFWRRCGKHHQLKGLAATARLADGTMQLFDDLVADGVETGMRSDGLLFACLDSSKAEQVLDGLRPMQEFGYELPDIPLEGNEMRCLEPALGQQVRAGFLVPGERALRPDIFVDSLARRLRQMGAEILDETEVTGMRESGKRVSVRTRVATLDADAVVLAAGAWSARLASGIGLPLHMQAGKGYSFSIRPKQVPARPLYLYEARVGCSPQGDSLRFAGTMEFSGINTRLDGRRVESIARSAATYMDFDVPTCDLTDTWTGMRPVTADGLPTMGRVPGWGNLYIATGHSMLGVTLGPASGRAVADLVLGRGSDVLYPFRPERFGRWWTW